MIYNTSAYESVEGLRVLDGLVDVYLPDMKYGTDKSARVYSGIPDYVSESRAAVQEMHRQVGHLAVGDDGIVTTGLLVRPGRRSARPEVFRREALPPRRRFWRTDEPVPVVR